MSKITTHLRSNAIAYAALLLTLPGTAWAAGQIGANDIKPDAVRSKHIKAAQVRGAEVLDESLTGADVGQLTGADIDEDTLGDPLVKRCGEGSVRATVKVNGTDEIGTSFSQVGTAGGFICDRNGGSPLVRRTGAGVYEVCFGLAAVPGSFADLAVATPVQTGAGSVGEDNIVTVGPRAQAPTCANSAGSVFQVRVLDIGPEGATPQDSGFVISVVD